MRYLRSLFSLHVTGLILALLACVLMALAPTLARAQRALQPQDPMWAALHEVCVAGGLIKAMPDQADTAGSGALDECGYCQLASNLGAPPVSHLAAVSAATGILLPFLFWQAPQRLHAWCVPAPRGPPALS